MKLFKFVFTVLPYKQCHLYNVNIEKVCQCNYLVDIFQISTYVCIRGGHLFSHCRSMSLYVGFIVKFEVVVC